MKWRVERSCSRQKAGQTGLLPPWPQGSESTYRDRREKRVTEEGEDREAREKISRKHQWERRQRTWHAYLFLLPMIFGQGDSFVAYDKLLQQEIEGRYHLGAKVHLGLVTGSRAIPQEHGLLGNRACGGAGTLRMTNQLACYWRGWEGDLETDRIAVVLLGIGSLGSLDTRVLNLQRYQLTGAPCCWQQRVRRGTVCYSKAVAAAAQLSAG